MSAAPAQSRRTRPRSRQPRADETAPIPARVKQLGYAPMVHLFGRLIGYCSKVEIGIFWHIYDQTIGRNEIDDDTGERPEWIRFSERELADLIHVTVDDVRCSLQSLLSLADGEPTTQSLIHARGGNGARREYRVVIENIHLREDRRPRNGASL